MRRITVRYLPTLGRAAFAAALLGATGCGDATVLQSARNQTSMLRYAAPAAVEATSTPPADKAESEALPAVPRKIIYNAQVTLVVESLNGFDERFARLVKESGGYVSQTDKTAYAQAQRRASWTVRVPVDRFDEFLGAVGRLGELQQSHVDSQDVTMEYYDLEARIANKQKEEERLLKHLSDSTGKLEDILAVERELSRVRGEIEQMQGRTRYLGNLSALSTVTVTVTEIHNYTPPVHPTFAGQVARTFRDSVDALVGFGKAAVLVAVAAAPWLPLVLVLALLIRWGVRKANHPRPFALPRAPAPGVGRPGGQGSS